MRRRLMLAAVICVIGMPGCLRPVGVGFTLTPRATFAGAKGNYQNRVKAVQELRENGALSEHEEFSLTFIIGAGEATFDQWEASLEMGEIIPPRIVTRGYNRLIRELIALRIGAERRQR